MIFNNKKNKKNKKKKGFSLVEALISITILMISVAAPLKLAGDGINSTSIAEQQIVAFYLTQDAMEYVKNIKTNNRLSHEDITTGLDKCNIDIPPNRGCRIDTVSGSIAMCSVGCVNGVLRFDENTGMYNYNNGNPHSIFTRQVKIFPKRTDPVTSAVLEMQVEVSTKWTSINNQPQEYKLKANLLDW
ncbi:MAG: prepilin-type N-terminal cleavage/methylation domain-containing protein [Candidatus Pacebacteria bacterium]|nr:prepilin-type N-terminal cleavage/methylation domain-containing protein [Candidatus Paceibacterota bacterium]